MSLIDDLRKADVNNLGSSPLAVQDLGVPGLATMDDVKQIL